MYYKSTCKKRRKKRKKKKMTKELLLLLLMMISSNTICKVEEVARVRVTKVDALLSNMMDKHKLLKEQYTEITATISNKHSTKRLLI